MQWSKPDFQEITLNMEVTAYVNTEDEMRQAAEMLRRAGGVSARITADRCEVPRSAPAK